MNIHFTGIKNIGYEKRTYNKYDEEYKERDDEHFIHIQLTDDYNGKDLTEFRTKMRKTGLRNYTHPVMPNTLCLMISKDVISNNLGKSTDYQIYINDADEELKINDDNIPMISFIARLLNRIKSTPNNEFIVNRDYLTDDDTAESIILGEDLRKTYGDRYDRKIREIHSPELVKKGAEDMNNVLQEIMMDYFA